MASNCSIIVGSRGSSLALLQTNSVVERLRRLWPKYEFRIKIIKTRGDEVVHVPLAKIGSQGVFVKEIETALLAGEIDLAVHSLKDMPSQITPGLTLVAILEREDVRDVLVSRDNVPLERLPSGARIGTSSPRRAAQLLAFRADLRLIDMRGNLDTRLRKARSAEYDGAILAAAGLKRMGWTDQISEFISTDICLPAVGQGALAVEVRAADERIRELALPLDHPETRAAVIAERSFMRALGGGCQAPVGALGRVVDGVLRLEGVVARLDGSLVLRECLSGSPEMAEQMGCDLAMALIARGAGEILDNVKKDDKR